jgi:hypothetical protein
MGSESPADSRNSVLMLQMSEVESVKSAPVVTYVVMTRREVKAVADVLALTIPPGLPMRANGYR